MANTVDGLVVLSDVTVHLATYPSLFCVVRVVNLSYVTVISWKCLSILLQHLLYQTSADNCLVVQHCTFSLPFSIVTD